MTEIAYLDGTYLPLQEARVPVLDRGFLLADGVYEVIAVYAGRIFALDAHLKRLDDSLAAILLANPHTRDHWRKILQTVVERNGGGNLMLYLQVTRGSQPKRGHALPVDPKPCIVAFCQPLPPIADDVKRQGVSAITLEDTRWLNCHIKSIALLGNVLLTHQALQAGCNEAILLRAGEVTEGASSNVFIAKDGTLATPPKGRLILPGITRDILIELARAENIGCTERPVTEEQLRDADEVWITSTTRELYPVTSLDGRPVGDGKPGPLWQRLFAQFQTRKNR
jgi:D-alanine transaminase